MKFIKSLKNIKLTVSGSYAIYFLLCVFFVTSVGLYGIIGYVINVIQKFIENGV